MDDDSRSLLVAASARGSVFQGRPVWPLPNNNGVYICTRIHRWSMQRSLILLSAGLLALAAPASAIYVEGYEPPTFHDVTFEIREGADGLLLVLAEGNFSLVQQGHHLNITVNNTLSRSASFAFLSTLHGDDPIDDDGNVTPSTRTIGTLEIPAGETVVQGFDLPNDTLRLRFEADDGTDQASFDQDLMMFLAASTGGLEEDGNADLGGEPDKDSPLFPVGLLTVALMAAALVRRR